MKGFEFKSGIVTFARQLCERSGTKFIVNFTGDGAATDGAGNIFLPQIDDRARVSPALVKRYTAFVLHEFGHVEYTWFHCAHLIQGNNRTYARSLWNAVEDGYIERELCKSIPGASALLSELVQSMHAEAEGIDWSDPAQWPFALALWSRTHTLIRPPVPDAVAAIFDSANVQSPTNTRECVYVANAIYEQIEQLLRDQDDQSKQGDQNDQGSDSDPLDGVDPTAVEPDLHADKIESESQRAERQRKRPHRCASDEVYDLGDERIEEGRYQTLIPEVVEPKAKLRNEFRRLFDKSATEAWDTGRRAGQVNPGALHRHTFDDGVFRRRSEREGIETAVSILIDCSGSTTSDNLLGKELSAAQTIAMALESARVTWRCDAFSQSVRQVCDWGDGLRKLSARAPAVSDRGTTDDIQALNMSASRLLGRPEQRKVILILTDGVGDYGFAETRKAVERIERNGITVIGIGIGVDVSEAYRQFVNVTDTKALAEASLAQIKLCA